MTHGWLLPLKSTQSRKWRSDTPKTRQTQHSIEAGEQTCRSLSWGHTQLWTVPVASSPFPILCRMTSSLQKLL